ncbi:hypothetical protein [Variovorax sp. V512]|uniref:hypothetical protein n=2 Tax=Variovorax TaxID=34072 RepID=UPI0034E88ECE
MHDLEKARQRMIGTPEAARQALAPAGFSALAMEAMLRATPDLLLPGHAGIEPLAAQRRSCGLLGADFTYEQLVDTSALPGG